MGAALKRQRKKNPQRNLSDTLNAYLPKYMKGLSKRRDKEGKRRRTENTQQSQKREPKWRRTKKCLRPGSLALDSALLKPLESPRARTAFGGS